MNQEGPRYVRQEPERWQELLGTAECFVADQPWLNTAHIEAMMPVVAELDNDTLEENRYYGLGLVVCGLARKLQGEDRHRVVRGAASQIVSNSVRDGIPLLKEGGNVRFKYLEGSDMDYQITDVAVAAAWQLPAPKRLLVETLSNERRLRTPNTLRISEPEILLPFDLPQWLLTHSLAGEAAGFAAVSATATVARLAIKAVRETDENMLISAEDLAELDVSSFAPRLATLRLDELSSVMGAREPEYYSELGDEGRVLFRKDLIERELPDPPDWLLHKKRLKCPALHVAGMIPLMRGILADVVDKADKMMSHLAETRGEEYSRLLLNK